MSRIARSTRLLKNAEAALISAIEIYNKPAFGYREETFANSGDQRLGTPLEGQRARTAQQRVELFARVHHA